MKIWVIGRSYPIKKNKMRGSFEVEQAKMLARRGHDVTYIALIFHPLNKIENWGKAAWSEDGIKVRTYSQFYALDRMHLHLRKFQESKWNKFLMSIEQETGVPDIIHVHYPAMITEASVILKYQEKHVKIVVTDHWTHTLMGNMDGYECKRLKLYAEKADEFICVGEPLAESVKKITGTSRIIHVVPNVVSDIFKPLNTGVNRDYFLFIAVGRVVPIKQFDVLVKAFARAFKNNENVRLKIIGGGDLNNLRKISTDLGVEDRVELAGTQSRENVAKFVAESDCLVCPSRLETFGVPVIEAWACGLPVVSTNAIGFLSYWKEWLGEIVPWDSEEKMSDALVKVFNNIDHYNKFQITEYANKYFSEDAVYDMLIKIYNNDWN